MFGDVQYLKGSGIHVLSSALEDPNNIQVWKFELPGFTSVENLRSVITLRYATTSERDALPEFASQMSVGTMSDGSDLLTVCFGIMDPNEPDVRLLNIWSIKTTGDSTIANAVNFEINTETLLIASMEGVSSSASKSYIVIRDSNNFNFAMIEVDPTNVSN